MSLGTPFSSVLVAAPWRFKAADDVQFDGFADPYSLFNFVNALVRVLPKEVRLHSTTAIRPLALKHFERPVIAEAPLLQDPLAALWSLFYLTILSVFVQSHIP